MKRRTNLTLRRMGRRYMIAYDDALADVTTQVQEWQEFGLIE